MPSASLPRTLSSDIMVIRDPPGPLSSSLVLLRSLVLSTVLSLFFSLSQWANSLRTRVIMARTACCTHLHQRACHIPLAFHIACRNHKLEMERSSTSILGRISMNGGVQRRAPEADRIGCAPIKTLYAFAMKLQAAALRILVISFLLKRFHFCTCVSVDSLVVTPRKRSRTVPVFYLISLTLRSPSLPGTSCHGIYQEPLLSDGFEHTLRRSLR
jgi:hypothetical protein